MKTIIKSISGEILLSIEGPLTSADLSGVNLRGADLYGANLSGANLRGANLSMADLFGANLSRTSLSWTNLRGTNLSMANLSGANLSRTDLSGISLRGVNLSGANLSGANLYDVDFSLEGIQKAKNWETSIAKTRILPQGDLIGWKKCRGDAIVKLLIPAHAKRSHAFGRKCRASEAKVIGIFGKTELLQARSIHDSSAVYLLDKTVFPDSFDEDWTKECAAGIHFFITREEAEDYDVG